MLAALLRVRQAYILSDRSRACRRINSCCCLLQVQLCECRQGVEVASGAVGSLSWGSSHQQHNWGRPSGGLTPNWLASWAQCMQQQK